MLESLFASLSDDDVLMIEDDDKDQRAPMPPNQVQRQQEQFEEKEQAITKSLARQCKHQGKACPPRQAPRRRMQTQVAINNPAA